MLDQALGLFDDHLGDLDVAHRRLVEGRGNHLALHRALHVGDFLRPLVDQKHDQIAFRMIVGDRMGDVLQQHGLAGARRRHDQGALAFADRRHDVDDARREILLGRILVFHLQPLVRIERRQVVEIDLVARFLRVFEVERVDLEQGEVALAFLRAADMAVDGVAGAQAETADLRGRDVDIVRSRQIIRFRRAQKAEAVRENLDDAFADNVGLPHRELLEDAEHQLLLAHGAGVFDLELLRKGDELGRRLGFEVLEFHFPHTDCPMENRASGGVGMQRGRQGEREVRRSWVAKGLGAPDPMHQPAPVNWSQNSITSAYVRWDFRKIENSARHARGETDCALATPTLKTVSPPPE